MLLVMHFLKHIDVSAWMPVVVGDVLAIIPSYSIRDKEGNWEWEVEEIGRWEAAKSEGTIVGWGGGTTHFLEYWLFGFRYLPIVAVHACLLR